MSNNRGLVKLRPNHTLGHWAAFQNDFLRHNSVDSQDLAKSYGLGIQDGRTVAL